MATDFYKNFNEACQRHNTTITQVLNALNHASGAIGNWKNGSSPRLELAMEVSDYLNEPLEAVAYGEDHYKQSLLKLSYPKLTDEQLDWLSLLDKIPEDKRQICFDFLQTHAEQPKKHARKKRA